MKELLARKSPMFQMPITTIMMCGMLWLTACNAQTTDSKKGEVKNRTIGNVVTEMDRSIWCIYQDKKGDYWFGSNGSGVYRYDGMNLTKFTTDNGLQSNQVRGIQEDGNGDMYFETRTTVTKYDGQKFIALTPIESGLEQWRLQPGDLWFRGNGEIDGVYRYDGKTLYHLDFSAFNPQWKAPKYAVYSIYKDKQGSIWFGTLSAGVCRYDGKTLEWIREKELSVLDDGRVPAVRFILEDSEGYFWLGNILNRYKVLQGNADKQSVIKYTKAICIQSPEQRAKMILPYCTSAIVANGNIWMTNYNEGVWKYDGEKLVNYKIKDGTTEALVVSIYKDATGALWVGTDNMGVYKYNGEAFGKFRF